MAKKKNDSVWGLIGWGIFLWVLYAVHPALILLGILGIAVYIGHNLREPAKPSRDSASKSTIERRIETPHGSITVAFGEARRSDLSANVYPPRPPTEEVFAATWIPAGQKLNHCGLDLPGGMFYVGATKSESVDPSMINTRSQVSGQDVDISERQMGYWPSYSTISTTARRAYLQWLSTGRRDPNADVGYVFLFFYGLERRALVDAPIDPVAKAELPLIENEVRRLLDIYGQSRSLRGYANSFLEVLEASRFAQHSRIDASKSPLATKLAIGKLAGSGLPLTADIALEWIKSNPTFTIPKRILSDCPNEFAAAFKRNFEKAPGGIKLPTPKLNVRIAYKPASSALMHKSYSVDLKCPDLSASTSLSKKLTVILDATVEQLGRYSRAIGKATSKEAKLDALLLLPSDLWPESAKAARAALDAKVGTGLISMTLGELTSAFGGTKAINRDRAQALVHALEDTGIGFEPDILAGARTPKLDDQIVLFRTEREDSTARQSPVYRTACVALDLACAVILSDDKATAAEIRQLMAFIDSLTVTQSQRQRLRARAKAGLTDPPTLASMRKQIDLIPQTARRPVAHLLSTMVHADGEVTQAEVKILEKAYKALGVDVAHAYSDLHAVAAGGVTPIAAARQDARKRQPADEWDPLESTCRHASLSIL